MLTLRPAVPSILLIVFLFLPGCAAPAPAQPAAQPASQPAVEAQPAPQVDIRGRVTQSRRNAQGDPPVGTVQIEGTLEPGTRYDKAIVHVGHQTKIFLGRGGKQASFSFLHSGDLVEVTFTGPVAESQPVKATADRIVILEHVP
jgi:hypothetical protein